jgi:succinoglycan biosynthesis transport protein ExoP
LEILTLLQVLWRRKWTIAASALSFMLVGILASLLLPVQYTATTAVIVDTDDSATSLLSQLGLQEVAKSMMGATDDIQNKIYLATSQPVVDQLIWKLQLRNKNGELYEADDVGDPGLLAPVLGTPGVEIAQEQGTDVLLISGTGSSPENARMIADTLAEVYIDQTTAAARGQFQDAKRFIEDRLRIVTGELDDAYGQFADVQRQTDIIDLDGEQKAAVARLSSLTLDREQNFAKIKETQAKLRSTRDFRQQESVDEVSSATLTTNPIIGRLKQSLSESYSERQALLLDHYTEKAPEVVEINAKIDSAREQLADALADQQALDPQVAQIEADLEGLLAKQAAITAGIDQMQRDSTSWPDLKRRFSQLQLQINAAEQVYRELEDQSYQIGIAESMTMSDIRVTARAAPPEKQSSPLVLLNLVAAAILGIGFGCASALAFEYLDDTVRTSQDLRDGWDLPQLGMIPRYRPGIEPALATLSPTDPLFEAHRSVRNAIDFASVDKPIQLLGITSSIPGEGKSTIAANLAISMASEGKRVLLVDADLRAPSLHRRFKGAVSQPGLVEVVSRTVPPADATQKTAIPNLDLITSGALPPNPAQLVESLRMRQTLLELARSYDVVVLDMPPALAVNDPIVMSRVVDGVFVVVGAQEASKRMLQELRYRFETARVTPIGFVLNKVRAAGMPYGRYARHYATSAPRRPAAAVKTSSEGAA